MSVHWWLMVLLLLLMVVLLLLLLVLHGHARKAVGMGIAIVASIMVVTGLELLEPLLHLRTSLFELLLFRLNFFFGFWKRLLLKDVAFVGTGTHLDVRMLRR